jgi:tRNA pseudouridine55 synthase
MSNTVIPHISDGSRESPRPHQQHGVLALNKPGGMTSAACVGKIKRALGQKKIGHAGTLDPMATGVLLILLGQATKLSGHLMDDGDKIYSGVIRLGVVTDTWDAEGEVLERNPVTGVDAARVREAMTALTGEYEQQVPAYSAAKHRGTPLYALARKGAEVPVKTKMVRISRGEAELVGPERIRFRVACGSGTYIRSLAHSLGKRLGCGGMLEELTREYSHPFDLASAHDFATVLGDPEGFPARVRGIAEALPAWPRVPLDSGKAALARQGGQLPWASTPLPGHSFAPGIRALLLTPAGEALALAETVLGGKDKQDQVWGIVRGLWPNPMEG